ncbi:MAG: DUF916 domain-containing protein [Bacteroidales bacterium]|nr:DUF916 domain-containing protein [Bacteroidales bacterium]MCF8404213.1 DUF916 domain-containing protein [Bacteroidales bacterium]
MKKISFNVITTVIILLTVSLNFVHGNSNIQDDEDLNKGVTVSPSNLKFNVGPGKTTTKNIKVSNYTSVTQKFRIIYNDFDISNDGKSTFMESGKSAYSLSKFVNISPTFIEIAPGTAKDVTVTVTIPSGPEGLKAAWGVILIEQMEEKKVLDPGNNSGNTVAFGITPTYAFGIWIYQNPPQVENMLVDITNFYYETKDSTRLLYLNVENKGDGISFCNAYVELAHLKTGDQEILGGKRYTILPGYKRSFIFELSPELEAGSYSAVGVLDYNSEEELVAAELDFTIE